MRELDLVLMRYLEQCYPLGDDEEREAFVTLLDREDPVLFGWLLGDEPPGQALQIVVGHLRAFRQPI
jgi:succinate dehydrogenase flavin-adding protein (antitoxin of CptAB toxin-antitoxin module)